jgi:hypothetical protein
MRGLTAWQETYYEGVRQMQMLQAAEAWLTRPLLTATFLYWREDWDAAEQARRVKNFQERAPPSHYALHLARGAHIAPLHAHHTPAHVQCRQLRRDSDMSSIRGSSSCRYIYTY